MFPGAEEEVRQEGNECGYKRHQRNPGEDRNLLFLDSSCDIEDFGEILSLGKPEKGHTNSFLIIY